MRVLVTGGAGFIGSHQVVALLEAGHVVHVVDDLSNSSKTALARVAELTGEQFTFDHADLLCGSDLVRSFDRAEPDAVIHFAGRKHVHESIQKPAEYYRVNIGGLLGLLDVMDRTGVRDLVYSSSGSIYGDAAAHPIPESAPIGPTNPYSRTKAQGEQILSDVCCADDRWRVTALRYFNPAGAHPSGSIGEDPTGLRTNLLPVLMDVAVGLAEHVVINGTDYPTPDGTAVRDYVHVMDVVAAHVAALEPWRSGANAGFRALNIGRGVGVSVLELIEAVERISGRAIKRIEGPRRPGDVAALYGDPARAVAALGVTSGRDLDEICADSWRWRSRNPLGYP